MTEPTNPPALHTWTKHLETVLTEPFPERVTHLWEASSDQYGVTVAAGAVRLAEGVDLDHAAYRLRTVLEDLTADATLSVTVLSVYDDNTGDDWTGRGVSESADDYQDDGPDPEDVDQDDEDDPYGAHEAMREARQ